jgi:hypothetical protein
MATSPGQTVTEDRNGVVGGSSLNFRLRLGTLWYLAKRRRVRGPTEILRRSRFFELLPPRLRHVVPATSVRGKWLGTVTEA